MHGAQQGPVFLLVYLMSFEPRKSDGFVPMDLSIFVCGKANEVQQIGDLAVGHAYPNVGRTLLSKQQVGSI